VRPAWANNLRACLEKTLYKKWAGEVAQSEGPEFKP
jgi:hypothetical protein